MQANDRGAGRPLRLRPRLLGASLRCASGSAPAFCRWRAPVQPQFQPLFLPDPELAARVAPEVWRQVAHVPTGRGSGAEGPWPWAPLTGPQTGPQKPSRAGRLPPSALAPSAQAPQSIGHVFRKRLQLLFAQPGVPVSPPLTPGPLEKAGHRPGQQPPAPGGYLSLNSNSVELKTQFLQGIGARGATRDSTAGVCHCTASAGPRWAGATATLDPGHAGWLFGSHCHLSR